MERNCCRLDFEISHPREAEMAEIAEMAHKYALRIPSLGFFRLDLVVPLRKVQTNRRF
jgi:hypothetical protein